MDIEVLSEYVTLCSCRSFREAAQRCYISKSTLSAHISKLEREVGGGTPVQLIERQDGFRLTDAGMVYLRAAQEALATLDEAERRCRSMALGDTVRVATGLVHRNLVTRLEELEEVPFEFIDLDGSQPDFGQLVNGTADVMFEEDLDADEDLRARAMELGLSWAFAFEMPFAIIMMADHPLAALDNLTTADLTGAKVALLGSLSMGPFERTVKGLFAADPMFRFVYEPLGSSKNMMHLSLGDKIAFVHADWALEAFSHSDDVVVRCKVDGAPLIGRVSVVWNNERCTPNARVFAETLRDNPLTIER
jgi:DNA-binding transcriptional LysR family regulator